MKLKSFLLSGLLVLVLSQTACTAAGKNRDVFQNFKLQDLNGGTVDLYGKFKDKGKVIILDLFATWCPPCRAEIPDFIELQSRYSNDLVIIGAGFDQGNTVRILKDFSRKVGINYTVLAGSEDLAEYVGLRGIPRTFVLGPDFSIYQDLTGARAKRDFEGYIAQVMQDIKPAAVKKTGKDR